MLWICSGNGCTLFHVTNRNCGKRSSSALATRRMFSLRRQLIHSEEEKNRMSLRFERRLQEARKAHENGMHLGVVSMEVVYHWKHSIREMLMKFVAFLCVSLSLSFSVCVCCCIPSLSLCRTISPSLPLCRFPSSSHFCFPRCLIVAFPLCLSVSPPLALYFQKYFS